MISDIEMESNTNNNGQFVFRVDNKVDNETCTANTGSGLLYHKIHISIPRNYNQIICIH